LVFYILLNGKLTGSEMGGNCDAKVASVITFSLSQHFLKFLPWRPWVLHISGLTHHFPPMSAPSAMTHAWMTHMC